MQDAPRTDLAPGVLADVARLRCDRGQTAVEYSLILGLVVVAVVLALPALWWVTFGIYDQVVQAFTSIGLAP